MKNSPDAMVSKSVKDEVKAKLFDQTRSFIANGFSSDKDNHAQIVNISINGKLVASAEPKFKTIDHKDLDE